MPIKRTDKCRAVCSCEETIRRKVRRGRGLVYKEVCVSYWVWRNARSDTYWGGSEVPQLS
ncbi:hypothetical protein [Spirosoma aerophilum]